MNNSLKHSVSKRLHFFWGSIVRKLLLFGMIGLGLAACDAGFKGTPQDSLSNDRDFNSIIINSTLNETRLRNLASQSFVDAVTRNSIIEARMAEIDVLYYEYENNISSEIRRGNFATSLGGIIVGAVGAQATGRSGQNLSALSGVIAGGSAAYQKEVLLDQSVQAFISQMRANRNVRKSEILAKLGQPGTAYSLQAAISDLSAYQQAGTLASAIAGITEQAKAEEKSSGTTLQSVEASSLTAKARLNRQPLNSTQVSRSVPAYIAAGTTNAERRRRNADAIACFDKSSTANKPTDFAQFLLNQGQHPELASFIADCLGI
jgi:hypothetical protein